MNATRRVIKEFNLPASPRVIEVPLPEGWRAVNVVQSHFGSQARLVVVVTQPFNDEANGVYQVADPPELVKFHVVKVDTPLHVMAGRYVGCYTTMEYRLHVFEDATGETLEWFDEHGLSDLVPPGGLHA